MPRYVSSGTDRYQLSLLPMSFDEMISEDNPVRVIDIVEHPFGTIKRSLGYTYFLLRGIEKVTGEAVMHCLVYNLKRVLSILGTKGLIAAMR